MIHKPNRERDVPNMIRPWDPQVLGLCTPSFHSERTKLRNLLDAYRGKAAAGDIVAKRQGDEYLLTVNYQFGKEETRKQLAEIRYTIDANRFIPTKIENWLQIPRTDKWFSSPRTVDLKWKEINGAWVPRSIIMSDRRQATEVKINWEKVNETMDESLFAYNNWKFRIPSRSPTIDSEGPFTLKRSQIKKKLERLRKRTWVLAGAS